MDPSLLESSFPVVAERPVGWIDREDGTHRAKNLKGIVETNTGKVFSVVSKEYQLVRHEQAIEQVENVICRAKTLGPYSVTTDFYNQGGRMRRVYRFPEKAEQITPGDYVNPEIHLLNSYDISWPFEVILGGFRVLCRNGLIVEERLLHLRQRHIFDLNRLNLEREILSALERFIAQAKKWKKWADTDTRLTRKTHGEVMKAVGFGKKATEAITERIAAEAQGQDKTGFPVLTLWAFFNVLTWYITHRAVSVNHRMEMEKRLRGALRYFRK